jgi:hypothetical protein
MGITKWGIIKPIPCEFDHNGECLTCDCLASECEWKRLRDNNWKYESREELSEMFKDFLEKNYSKEDAEIIKKWVN